MVIKCECGWTVRADESDEVVQRARVHLEENHPDVAAGLSDDDILAMAEEQPSPS
jgi:predicted small metal-binding protein